MDKSKICLHFSSMINFITREILVWSGSTTWLCSQPIMCIFCMRLCVSGGSHKKHTYTIDWEYSHMVLSDHINLSLYHTWIQNLSLIKKSIYHGMLHDYLCILHCTIHVAKIQVGQNFYLSYQYLLKKGKLFFVFFFWGMYGGANSN